jgi:unsaturated rhamnogalacturonyl hydrolase
MPTAARFCTLLLAVLLVSGVAHAQRAPQPSYPIPYPPATAAEISKVLQRVQAFTERATPARVVDTLSGEAVAPGAVLPKFPGFARTDILVLTYEAGLAYSGMFAASAATADSRYRELAFDRLNAISRLASQVVKSQPLGTWDENQKTARDVLTLRALIAPRSLDDSGSMCAAMIKAQRLGQRLDKGAGFTGNLRPWIDHWAAWVSTQQHRLADGTLARNRPMPNTLWLDDLYMSVPCLAQMGVLTGERRYFDDAAKQILQFAARMFVKERGLYMHGWVEDMNPHPAFFWGRANGWAAMAAAELLEVLPQTHPERAKILELFKAHAAGLIANQGHAGLWHQLLDRRESYEETSASAMFVFALARGINRGWLDARAFGPAVSLGWNGVASRVNEKGEVEGTCIGTGMGWDPMFYLYRPVSVLAAHGYGPVLLAGAEMIELTRGAGQKANQNGGVQYGEATSKY